MRIQLVGSGEAVKDLEKLVLQSLQELSLEKTIGVEVTDDQAYKIELGITENPALALEEESIEFKDVIFQGVVPEYEEIKNMFISILGDDASESSGGCGPGGCSGCTGCG